MTGRTIQGQRGFAPKEGVNFNARVCLRLHSDELAQVLARKRKDESAADYIRAAIREKLLRDAR